MPPVEDELRTVLGALKAWLVARTYNALIVGALWLLGLWLLHVPWAPFWAGLGTVLQFIPNFGAMLALIGPAFTALASGGWMGLVYVLILYAVIAVLDGMVLDPMLMRHKARVPIWASIVTPIVLGIVWPFWGVVVAAPLLAVVYAFRAQAQRG